MRNLHTLSQSTIWIRQRHVWMLLVQIDPAEKFHYWFNTTENNHELFCCYWLLDKFSKVWIYNTPSQSRGCTYVSIIISKILFYSLIYTWFSSNIKWDCGNYFKIQEASRQVIIHKLNVYRGCKLIQSVNTFIFHNYYITYFLYKYIYIYIYI